MPVQCWIGLCNGNHFLPNDHKVNACDQLVHKHYLAKGFSKTDKCKRINCEWTRVFFRFFYQATPFFGHYLLVIYLRSQPHLRFFAKPF